MTENLLIKQQEQEEEIELEFKQKIWKENKKIWAVAGPAICTRFSSFGASVITQAFIGHIGSTEMAAYSLVSTVLLRFSSGILLGMATALQTLCGQSYGAKQYQMLGIYLQRSWIVLVLCAILLLPLFFFTAPILIGLGQDSNIAKEAGIISLWSIPISFISIISFTCQMFLQAQSKNMIITYLAAFSLFVHTPFSWLLTVKYKFGVPGTMCSAILAYFIPNIGQLMFVICGGCRETWKGFSFLAFKDLLPVIKISLSSGAMICLELWYNTILVLLTGNMQNAEVSIDALSICLNISGWQMMISLGFSAAAGVRVSNELGRGSSKAAKFSIVMIVAKSFIIGFVLFVLFLFLRGNLAYIFTQNHEVIDAVADLSHLLAISMLINSIQPVLSGVAVGAGWQSIVVYVNIACYYFVGIPVGVFLGYVMKMQVKGVWIGMLLGAFTQTIVLIIITCRTDWEKQVCLARDRNNKWHVADSKQNKQEHNTCDFEDDKI